MHENHLGFFLFGHQFFVLMHGGRASTECLTWEAVEPDTNAITSPAALKAEIKIENKIAPGFWPESANHHRLP